VTPARGFPAQVVADDRPRQPRVGGHPVRDGVGEIDQASGHWPRSGSTPAVSQMRTIVSPILLFGVEAPAVIPMIRAPPSQSAATASCLVPIGWCRRVRAVGSTALASSMWNTGTPRLCTSAARWQVLLELYPPTTTMRSSGRS